MEKIWNYVKKHKWSCLILCIVAVVCGMLLKSSYATLLLCYIGIYGIATTGLDLLWGYTGQISYGHAGFYATGAYTSALLSTQAGVPPFFSMLIGALFSTVVGIIIAFPAAKLVKHFLALLTLAFGQIIYMFVNSAQKITNGSAGIRSIPKMSIFGYVLDTNAKMFFLIAAFLILVLFIKSSVINSRTGRAFIAVRENAHAANGIGINPVKYKVMAFALSAMFTGLAGGLYAHLLCFISPDTFQNTQSVIFMTMLLFGGIGSFYGPLVGSVVIVLLKELLQVFSTYQQLVYAAFILVVLFLLPNGIAGVFKVAKEKLGKKKQEGVVGNAEAR